MSGRGEVLIHGKRAKITSGRVCMDQFMVDSYRDSRGQRGRSCDPDQEETGEEEITMEEIARGFRRSCTTRSRA
ncbi:MAG: alanine racemase C-terminal domain-containing protein [Pilosibacter sp.]